MNTQKSLSLPQNGSQWDWIFKLGGIAALVGVTLIPIQIIIYVISPPPTLINEWFLLFQRSSFLGLLNFDVLYIINNILLIPFYLALYAALKADREAMAITALIFGLVGLAIYFPSNTAFEMLKLSEQYMTVTTEVQRSILLAQGQMLLAQANGTAFVVYYLLSAIALLLFSAAMLQSQIFSRNTAYAGISAGLLMLVPSTVGTIGLLFAFVSLLPWAIFSILVSRTLLQPGRKPL